MKFFTVITLMFFSFSVLAEKTPVGKVWDTDLVSCGAGFKRTNCNPSRVTKMIDCVAPTKRADDTDLPSSAISHFTIEAIPQSGGKVVAKRFVASDCPFPLELHTDTWRLRAKTFLHNSQKSLFSAEIIHVIP